MKNAVFTLKSQFPWMLKAELHRWLAASAAFSVLMVAVRIAYTGELTFIFLVWNLFLAYVPLFITGWLQGNPRFIEARWKFAAAFLCWLLFVPNAFYIITDLFHMRTPSPWPVWFDLALILSFAWNGLLPGIISVREMERMMRLHVGYKNELWFIFPIMCLNAFGVYIGRFLRFNSWDVLTSPFGMALDIADVILHPNKTSLGMVACYSVLMTIIYITIHKLNRQLNK